MQAHFTYIHRIAPTVLVQVQIMYTSDVLKNQISLECFGLEGDIAKKNLRKL